MGLHPLSLPVSRPHGSTKDQAHVDLRLAGRSDPWDSSFVSSSTLSLLCSALLVFCLLRAFPSHPSLLAVLGSFLSPLLAFSFLPSCLPLVAKVGEAAGELGNPASATCFRFVPLPLGWCQVPRNPLAVVQPRLLLFSPSSPPPHQLDLVIPRGHSYPCRRRRGSPLLESHRQQWHSPSFTRHRCSSLRYASATLLLSSRPHMTSAAFTCPSSTRPMSTTSPANGVSNCS